MAFVLYQCKDKLIVFAFIKIEDKPLFSFPVFQVIQHQTVKYEVIPLSPLSKHRLSKYTNVFKFHKR